MGCVMQKTLAKLSGKTDGLGGWLWRAQLLDGDEIDALMLAS
jgi:hypothetical protein